MGELARVVAAEAHVKVPLVIRAEGLHAIADRVPRQFLEVRVPVRIHRPVRFEETAHPVERLRPALVRRIFHRVVEADEATAAVHRLRDALEMVALDHRMPAAAVGINHHGVRLCELLLARPLRVEMHLGRDLRRALSETLREELDAGVVFVLARPVRRLSGDQDDQRFALGGLGVQGREPGGNERGEEEGRGFHMG